MAHFAKLGAGNIVERVEVVANDIATTEEKGIEFLKSLHGNDTVWVQTSYNSNIRKNYAGVGYTYYQNLDDILYDDVYSCMIAGYKESSSKIIEIGPDDVNEYEIYIKFYCREYLEGVNA